MCPHQKVSKGTQHSGTAIKTRGPLFKTPLRDGLIGTDILRITTNPVLQLRLTYSSCSAIELWRCKSKNIESKSHIFASSTFLIPTRIVQVRMILSTTAGTATRPGVHERFIVEDPSSISRRTTDRPLVLPSAPQTVLRLGVGRVHAWAVTHGLVRRSPAPGGPARCASRRILAHSRTPSASISRIGSSGTS